MKYRLVSFPVIDINLLPLNLDPPMTEFQTGGYRSIDAKYHQGAFSYRANPSYSPIDLLVAGLEAERQGIKVPCLLSFFSPKRIILSENDVYIVYTKVTEENLPEGKLLNESIAKIKDKILAENDSNLLIAMRANAPFTFKHVRIS